MLKNSLLIISLGLSACLATGGLLAPTAAIAQQAKVSSKVGEPLKAALDAGTKGQYSQALAKLKEAEAAPGKTNFDQFKINETYGFVYLKQRNYAAAAVAYERSLNSGQLPSSQVNDRLKSLAQLNFQSPRDLAKVIDYSNRYLKATGGSDAAMNAMLGQAYQLQGNNKAAIASVQNAVRLSGGKPSENWLRILLKSYTALGDNDGAGKTIEQLVTLYPTQDNWRQLASDLRDQARGDDRTKLNVYRLMSQVDVMDRPDIYSEAAIVAIQSSLPAEAVQFMEKGLSRNIFGTNGKARAERILAHARKELAAQQAALAPMVRSTATSKDGAGEVRLGEILLSYGQADKALAAGKRALQEGASPDDAWMLIGRAQLQLKNGADARKAFNQVKGSDAAAIAKLWGIAASKS